MGQESFEFSASEVRRRAARRPARAAEASEPPAQQPPRRAKKAAAPAEEPEEARALTVTQLTHTIEGRLAELGRLRVEGEISGFKRTSSGHVYFDLKDEKALVSCVVWRSQAERALATKPADGMQVLVHGKLDVYGPHGRYKLIVSRVEPLGLGARLARLLRR